MKDSGKEFNGKRIQYKLYEDGYSLFLNEVPWMMQRKSEGGIIPFPNEATMEISCLRHIEEIIGIRTPLPEERIGILENELKEQKQVMEALVLGIQSV